MAKLVDVSGKVIGADDEKVKELEARVQNLESAMVLHGTFLSILKRFFDAIPGAAEMRKRAARPDEEFKGKAVPEEPGDLAGDTKQSKV